MVEKNKHGNRRAEKQESPECVFHFDMCRKRREIYDMRVLSFGVGDDFVIRSLIKFYSLLRNKEKVFF